MCHLALFSYMYMLKLFIITSIFLLFPLFSSTPLIQKFAVRLFPRKMRLNL